MTRTLASIALTLAASCFGCAVYAADESDSQLSPRQRHEALFRDLDSNHDGSLTADEVPQENIRLFERLKRLGDKNADGKLTIEEFVAGLEVGSPEGSPQGRGDRTDGPRRRDGERREGPLAQRRREREGRSADVDAKRPESESPGRQPDADRADRGRPDGPRGGFRDGGPAGGPDGMRGRMVGPALMRALDANADGKLSSSEISDAASSLKKFDKNGDGEITRAELGPPQMAGDFGGGLRGRPEGNLGRTDDGPGQRPNPEAILSRLKQLDKDGDGKLKKEDLPERMQQRFEQMDADGDGVVDQSELKAFFESMMRRFGEGRGGLGEGAGAGQRRRGDRTEGRAAAEKNSDKD